MGIRDIYHTKRLALVMWENDGQAIAAHRTSVYSTVYRTRINQWVIWVHHSTGPGVCAGVVYDESEWREGGADSPGTIGVWFNHDGVLTVEDAVRMITKLSTASINSVKEATEKLPRLILLDHIING